MVKNKKAMKKKEPQPNHALYYSCGQAKSLNFLAEFSSTANTMGNIRISVFVG